MTSGRYAPFIHTRVSASFIDFSSMIALLPCASYAVFKYGLRALMLIIISAALAVLVKYILDAAVSKRSKILDYSPIVPGVIFALMLPPDTSLAVVAAGILFMVMMIFFIFGGNGANIVNGAAAARLFVESIWPSYLRGYTTLKNDWLDMSTLVKMTKLPMVSMPATEDYHLSELLAGGYPGFIGTGAVIMILIGLVYLIRSGSIKLYASGGYIVSLMAVRLILHYKDGLRSFATFMILSSVLFVAVFILTDRSTVPQTVSGGMITGFTCGVLTAALFEISTGIVPVLVPVIAVNLISGIVEYLTSYASERHAPVKMTEEGADGL